MNSRCETRELHEVAQIEPGSGCSCLIVFDDGTRTVIGFSECLDRGPVFAPLKGPEFFKRARVEGGMIAWPNGADIAPETLYEKCQQAAQTEA